MTVPTVPSDWYFITPPQEVRWEKGSSSREISTYGSNAPYLNYGTTKLRRLSLGNALVEGFSGNRQIEANVTNLEACMTMVMGGSGYVAPYCWNVFAGGKSYGTFVISNVNVKEEMRDVSGAATRARVDIDLIEVPAYQVGSGQDISSKALQGSMDGKYASAMADQEKKVAGAQASGGGSGGGAGGGGGGAEASVDSDFTKAQQDLAKTGGPVTKAPTQFTSGRYSSGTKK